MSLREGRPEISGTRGHDSSAQVPENKRPRVHEEVLNKKETAEIDDMKMQVAKAVFPTKMLIKKETA